MLSKNILSLLIAYTENDFRFIADYIKTTPKNASRESSLMMLTSADSFFLQCAQLTVWTQHLPMEEIMGKGYYSASLIRSS